MKARTFFLSLMVILSSQNLFAEENDYYHPKCSESYNGCLSYYYDNEPDSEAILKSNELNSVPVTKMMTGVDGKDENDPNVVFPKAHFGTISFLAGHDQKVYPKNLSFDKMDNLNAKVKTVCEKTLKNQITKLKRRKMAVQLSFCSPIYKTYRNETQAYEGQIYYFDPNNKK